MYPTFVLIFEFASSTAEAFSNEIGRVHTTNFEIRSCMRCAVRSCVDWWPATSLDSNVQNILTISVPDILVTVRA